MGKNYETLVHLNKCVDSVYARAHVCLCVGMCVCLYMCMHARVYVRVCIYKCSSYICVSSYSHVCYSSVCVYII